MRPKRSLRSPSNLVVSDLSSFRRRALNTNKAPHGVVCSCPLSGFEWMGDALTGSCQDIDECIAGGVGHITCSIHDGTVCQNTVGGHTCVCADGYAVNERQECKDINECEAGTSGCTQGCTNLPGTFQCGCSDGYTYNADTNTCDDIDECDATLCDSDANCALNQCGPRNRCNNLIGGWSCSCANADGAFDGANIWNADTGRCEDLNECEPQNGAAAACSPGSDCVNTAPGFSCSCKEGYTDVSTALDGSECVWSRYPESFVNIPGFSGTSIDAGNALFFISSNSGGIYQDVNAAKAAMQGMNNFRSLKCEEFFGLPHGIVKPGSMYLCDDANSRLTHARYSNQGRGWCVFQDYSVKCTHNGSTTLPGSYPLGSDTFIDIIAVSTNGGACHWDRDNGETYNDESNGMGVLDTALCQMQVSSQQEAALVCHAYGGRLFNEEVDNTTPQDPNYVSQVNGCLSYVDNYAKARGRLYQAKKVADKLSIDISNKQMLTAYQDCDLNGNFFSGPADNWCYLNYSPIGSTTWFGLPTLPMDQTPIGGHINHDLPWTNNANGYDCGIEMIADQVNAAMATGMDNIQAVVPGMALVWDVAEKTYKMRGHDSSFDFFVCERNAWDCDANGATLCPSGTCNPAGYCDCADGEFLDATTNQCIAKPDPVKIECFDDRMIAHFSVDSINAVDESNPLELLDGCGSQVSKVDGYWRVETRLDECGTVAEYGQNNDGEDIIIFHNYLNNQIDNNVGAHSQTHTDPNFQQTVFINKHSQVMSKFECHYRMITTVDDVNNYANEDIGPCVGPPSLCTGGPGGGPPGPGGIGVEASTATMQRSALGKLSFELKLYDSNTFRTEMPDGTKSRVGENLYFGVAATKKLTNIVHRATRCTIKGGDANSMDNKDEYVLFDDTVGEVDPYVETTRYSPFHMDGLNQQTCANEDLDKFSYRVFEFIDPVTNLPAQNSNQHIQCTVAVCIADEDMSSGPCGPSVCDYWNTNNDVEAADSTAPRRFG